MPTNDRTGYGEKVRAARATLGDDGAFDAAWQEGRALTMEQAMEGAMEGSL